MADQTERFVTIYDLGIAPARIHGSPLTERQPEDFRVLRDEVKKAATAKQLLSDKADVNGRRLYLMDMEVHERSKYVVFVWTLTDPNTAAQMYFSRGGRDLRLATKNDDEDVAVSAHMVVDFQVPLNSMRYPVAFEDHEGIARTRVQSLLQSLLQNHMQPVTAIISEGIEKSGPPKVTMDAHPGRVIGSSDLKPVEIELIKLSPRKSMTADTADPYYQSSERRTFKLVRDGLLPELQAQALSFVRGLRAENPEHTIRIRWRNSDDKQALEVTKLDPLERPERLLERALTRTIHLSGFRELPDATDKVVQRLAERMLASLRSVVSEDARRK